MTKVGRNDPCPCGSGKKYKQCHLPIEEAAQAEQRLLWQAQDTLLTKIIDAARDQAQAIPEALQRYWNGKYTVAQLAELDDLEDHGAERFLAWFAFDYPLESGCTLVELLAADERLELSDHEQRLLQEWTTVRLRPYAINSAVKGQTVQVRDLLNDDLYEVEDHAASRRVEPGEVLIFHLLPVGMRYAIGGAAAHLTADTREKLHEFVGLHLEAMQRDQPEATWNDLLRAQSEVLNHFVMVLPVEAPNPSLLDSVLLQTRAALQLTGESLGLRRSADSHAASVETDHPEAAVPHDDVH